MEELIQTVFKDFYSDKPILGYTTIDSGLINSTYKIETADEEYILQKMNQVVFPNIKALLNNKIKTTSYLNANGFPTLTFIANREGRFYSEQDDTIWQLSTYIPSAVLDRIDSNAVASQVGAYLAKFHMALLNFPVSELEYTIPDFHNTIKRFCDFEESIIKASPERLAQAKESIAFLESNFKSIETVASAINSGRIPLRVVHNDTKVGNMLFDEKGNILCIIDFDTVMPGSIFHDVGDALRTGTNTSTEEEKDLSKVCFDIEIYEAFMKAYVKEASSFMSEEESKNIHLSLPLILFEQACRFLGDYLNNDSYYTTTYEDQNLVRAKTQIKLMDSVQLYLKIKN
ncbi:aminoglycoside phosphotransferase family protein [Flavobacterium sp. ZT3R18]|uniref:phosphotransferase enzyme family protein n=1 Tax=Flavobacterium sp. ZT3R18 TaxID=2594429 RepID=UPI00117B79B5|nr:aminoglycoside phosphotransferase family protein [Flavobacterium sp. ZT3R18]TRX32025.1 aminoglycoside phosphotransferase family protein [Flavobacterium sp. ZT3R18]